MYRHCTGIVQAGGCHCTGISVWATPVCALLRSLLLPSPPSPFLKFSDQFGKFGGIWCQICKSLHQLVQAHRIQTNYTKNSKQQPKVNIKNLSCCRHHSFVLSFHDCLPKLCMHVAVCLRRSSISMASTSTCLSRASARTMGCLKQIIGMGPLCFVGTLHLCSTLEQS